jgi:23S rRNA U2552 (ribose-2'-O)-methylase RlmE/FtsJ
MNSIIKLTEEKYVLSEKYYKYIFDEQNDNNNYTYLHFFDLMNTYSLFPAIIDFNISLPDIKLSNIHDMLNINNNQQNINKNKETIDINNLKLIEKKMKLYTKKYKELKTNYLPRKLFSYEIIDEIKKSCNAEYVTTAWIKCYEILEYYKLLDNSSSSFINYFGLCEQPGAFIYAINHYTKQKLKKKFKFTISSLNSNINNAFKPEKKLYEKYKDNYDYGPHLTGDITDIDNIIYYKNTYKDIYFDLITADCGTDCTNNYSKQEEILANVIYGQIITSIALSDKGTSYFFKFFTFYNINSQQILYLLSLFYNEVYISRVIMSKIPSGELYCVCKNFKYKKSDMNSIIETLINIYKTYLTNNKILLFNNGVISQLYYDNLYRINDFFLHKRLININFLIYRLNNAQFTYKNTNVNEKIKNLVTHYVKYFIALYNINIINDTDKLVYTGNKRVQYKHISSSDIFHIDPILKNGLYMHYLIRNNIIYDFNTTNTKIVPIYHINKEKDLITNLNIKISDINLKFKLVFTRIIMQNLNSFENIIWFATMDNILDTVKYTNKYIKNVNVYFYASSNTTMSFKKQYYDNKMQYVMKKHEIEEYNCSYLENIDKHFKYTKKTMYMFTIDKHFNVLLNNVTVSNLIIELLLKLIINIDDKSCIVLTIVINSFILEIANMFSKYFVSTKIMYLKYYAGNTIILVFNNKKKNISTKEINFIKKILKNGHIKHLYDISQFNNLVRYEEIVNTYYNYMMAFCACGVLKYKNSDFYEILIDCINNHKKTYDYLFFNKYVSIK